MIPNEEVKLKMSDFFSIFNVALLIVDLMI
jgi:hypothetical protein